MNHGVQARRLGAGLLLWSLVPFPFVYVVLPPFWIVAAAAALWRLLRPQQLWRPSSLIQNALAVAVLLAVLLAGGFQVGPLRPLGHLLLSLTALRVLWLASVRDLKRALPAIFLVGIVGLVSSVHVSAVPYMLLSVAVWWRAGMWVLLASLAESTGVEIEPPRWVHAATAAAAAVVLAVPVFLVVPRFASPFLGGAFGSESGFPDAVELARRGAISENANPAIYLNRVDGAEIPEQWLRLRAAVYEMSSAAVWVPRRADLQEAEADDGLVWLTGDRRTLSGAVAVDMSIVEEASYLFIPPGGVAIETPEPLLVDSNGGVALATGGGGGVQYRVWVVPDAAVDRGKPDQRDTHLAEHDQRVCDLASEVAGEALSPVETAGRFEAFLKEEYGYSLEGGGLGSAGDPVAWFLFERRTGHCEFFAAAMVVLLRHEGIPARMVVGYHGGASEPGSSSVVVRQSNAHAWVEAWLGEDSGWVVFDPTPAEGVDGLGSISRIERLKMAWQNLEDFFDRRVLTFGLDEQIGLLAGAANALRFTGRWLLAHLEWLGAVPAVVVLLWLLVGERHMTHSKNRPASRAMVRLARLLERRGYSLTPSLTLRGVGARATRAWPQAARDVDRLVKLAEGEQYGPGRGEGSSRRIVRRLWASIRDQLRRPPSNAASPEI